PRPATGGCSASAGVFPPWRGRGPRHEGGTAVALSPVWRRAGNALLVPPLRRLRALRAALRARGGGRLLARRLPAELHRPRGPPRADPRRRGLCPLAGPAVEDGDRDGRD